MSDLVARKKGRFIVLEGLDGSGKGTQIVRLVRELQKNNTVYQTAEPTASAVGGLVRDILGGFRESTAQELSALFLADRIFHNVNPKNGIRQYIERGIDVVCDRYYYSSFAYQGIDAHLEWIMQMNLECDKIMKPDLCLFLDVDPDNCVRRLNDGRLSREIFENRDMLEKIRRRFFDVFDLLDKSENIKIIDAVRSEDEVHADIMAIVDELK